MATFYLSSTQEDLEEERAAVRRLITSFGHDVLGMEDYVAEKQRPLDLCLADVASRDGYVLILGFRYGSVPEGGSRSFTHEEFLHALEHCQGVHAFVMDAAAVRPVEHVDGDRTNVDAFRRTVNDRATTMSFTTLDELTDGVAKTLLTIYGQAATPAAALVSQIDRTDQRRALAAVLSTPARHPLVVVLHGREGEAHHLLTKDVRERVAPAALTADGVVDHLTVGLKESETSAAQVRSRLLTELADHHEDTLADAARQLGDRYPDHLIVQLELRSSAWETSRRDPLAAIAEIFEEWPVPGDQRLVVLVSLQYEPPSSRWFGGSRPTRGERRARDAVARAAERQIVYVIPELVPVEVTQARAWAQSAEVEAMAPEVDLVAAFRKIYEAEEATELPLYDLMQQMDRELADAGVGVAV